MKTGITFTSSQDLMYIGQKTRVDDLTDEEIMFNSVQLFYSLVVDRKAFETKQMLKTK